MKSDHLPSSNGPLNAIKWYSMVLILACTSCAPRGFYQVMETEGKNSTTVDGYHRYENDDVRVTYDFWGSGGKVSFRITNTSDLPIYIDWTKSHLIYNGVSHDYWSDSEKTTSFYFSNTSAFGSSNASFQVSGWGATVVTVATGSRRSSAQTTTVRERPKQLTHLPPHSSVDLVGSEIMSDGIFDCDFNWSKVKTTKTSKRTFSPEDSPLRFRNYLTYSSQAPSAQPTVIDNEFYISSAEFVPYKAYWGRQESVRKCTIQGVSVLEYERTRAYRKGISWYVQY